MDRSMKWIDDHMALILSVAGAVSAALILALAFAR
jgi:hypothetical protein